MSEESNTYEPRTDEYGRLTQRGSYVSAAEALSAANYLAHSLRGAVERAQNNLAAQGETGSRVHALDHIASEAQHLAILTVQFSRLLDPRSDPVEVEQARAILESVTGENFAEGVEFGEPYSLVPLLERTYDEDDEEESQ